MEHSFLDRYSDLDSPVHRLDPRAKVIFCICFVVIVVLTSPLDYLRFLGYLMLLTFMIILSRVPISYVLRRSLTVLPFVAGIALFLPFLKAGDVTYIQGVNLGMGLIHGPVCGPARIGLGPIELGPHGTRLIILWNIFVKSWLSALTMAILTSTTRFPYLLKGLARLGMPRIMVALLSFAYRYIFIFVDETMRMKRARDSRDCGRFGKGLGVSRSFWGYSFTSRAYKLRTVGGMIANLFLRAYERGERVYLAMKSRGFDGEVRTLDDLRFTPRDILFLAIMLGLLCMMRFVARGVL